MKPTTKDEEPEEKKTTLEDLVSEMVQKAVSHVRAEYEKTIADMEERTKKTISECEDRVRAVLAQMNHYVCYNCQKDLISGKDAIYTNFEGHKFCSATCIDEKKAEVLQLSNEEKPVS